MYEVHPPYTLTLISFINPPPPFRFPLYTQFCPSFLVFKLMFEGVSQCVPAVGILYFGPFNPFHYSPLPLYLPPPIFQQLSRHMLISSAFMMLSFMILLMFYHSPFLSLLPQVP
jgi:hypothetical protein